MQQLSSKKMMMFLFAALLGLLVLAVGTPASAEEYSSYNSGFQVKNLDNSNSAGIVMTFYQKDGTVQATVNDTIPAGDSTTYFPLPNGVSAGFDGSAVISSDRPVAAITNVIGDSIQNSSYSGFSSGSNTVSLPLTMKDAFDNDTWFNVQNTGSSATTVTVNYAGTSCTETATIQPSAAASFFQSQNTCLPSGFINSAQITTSDAGDSIVATVLQVTPTGLFAYNGFAAGSESPVMPLVAFNNFGFHTGVQLQNTGTTATNVTVTYTPSLSGSTCTETKSVAAGQSETFGLYAFSLNGPAGTNNCAFGDAFVGSAQVTTNSGSQPLVAIVNQTDFAGKSSAYSAFDPAQATETVVMPLIINAFNYFTGFNVINVGSSATVTCTFSGNSTTITESVPSGSALTAVQNTSAFANYVGGGSCTASSGGQLLAVVNQLSTTLAGDQQLTHEAFNE